MICSTRIAIDATRGWTGLRHSTLCLNKRYRNLWCVSCYYSLLDALLSTYHQVPELDTPTNFSRSGFYFFWPGYVLSESRGRGARSRQAKLF
jgi:hypothetical protein